MTICVVIFFCLIVDGKNNMIDHDQFRELIIRPVLKYLEPEIPYSKAAEELLLGTAIQESRLTYVKQLKGGPALGLFQMEPATYSDILSNYMAYRPDLEAKVNGLASTHWHGVIPAKELIANIPYAVALVRVHYWRSPIPLPTEGDIYAMAGMWKEAYNTSLGKGHEHEFIKNYKSTVMEVAEHEPSN